MRLLASIMYRFDRLFSPPRVEGRESLDDYSEWEYRVGKALQEEYAEWLGSISGKRILDIGCGLGGKTAVYCEAGADVTGIDIDPEHTEVAFRYARSKGLDIGFVMGDAARLPFSPGTFDMVIANDSMEHFPDPEAALREMARVVGVEGLILVFFTPWRSPLGSHLYDHIRTPWCHLLYSDRLIEELLEIDFEMRGEADPAAAKAEELEWYLTQNNRLGIAGYRKILARIEGLEVVAEDLKPPKFGFLRFLTRIPWIGELFTGTVISILRKKE